MIGATFTIKRAVSSVASTTSVLVISVSLVSLSHAAAWRVVPRVSLGAIYTDNVTLAPNNEEDEFITELGAGVSATRQGGRLNANIDYSVQGLLFSEVSGRNSAFHQLDSDATLEVTREQLFIDAESNITQQVIDPRRGGGADNIGVNNNRTSVFSAAIGPRFQQRVGTNLQLNADYQVSIVEQFDADDDAAAANIDSKQHETSASLGSIADRRPLQWILEYSQTRTDNENSVIETREEELRLSLFYAVARSLTLIGVVGEERNEFARPPNTEAPDGSFWEAGFRWQAGPRDVIELRRGERFFGETYSFDWQHQGRRYNGNVTYSEEVTTDTDNFLNDNNANITQLNGEATVSKQFNAGFGVTLPKSVISLGLFSTRNEFQLSLTEDKTRGAQVNWLWNVAPRTQLNTGVTAQRSEFGNTGQETEQRTFEVEASRQLSSLTTTSLGYSYTEFKSNVAADEFKANTLTFRISRTF